MRNGFLQGVCYAHNYQEGGVRGYGSDVSKATMKSLQPRGVRWLSLTPFGFQSSLSSTEVRHVGRYPGGETDERTIAEIRAARALGFEVLLKPHVWIRRGEFRGHIDPGSEEGWRAWFESYGRWMLRYAVMAEQESVPILAIGTEFGSSARNHPKRWRALIDAIREVYGGELVYCANWDEASDVQFWDRLDYVGIQFYPPLSSRGVKASPDAMELRMEGYVAEMERISQASGKPVLITEVGYRSAEGTLARPHLWPERDKDVVVSQGEQLLGYRTFFRGVRSSEAIAGAFIWKWFTDPSLEEEGPTGFSPMGKPAEASLRAAYHACDTPSDP